MKVTLDKEEKRYITLAEAPIAYRMIKEMKDDTGLIDYAKTAARVAGGSDTYEILKATAKIAKNNRIHNQYGDDSGTLDIWLDIYAYSMFRGFFVIGIYLSDIWLITGDNDNDIKKRMYIRKYEYVK